MRFVSVALQTVDFVPLATLNIICFSFENVFFALLIGRLLSSIVLAFVGLVLF